MPVVPTIDADFMAICPELTDDEQRTLRELIVEHGGARDPIACWNSTGYPTLDGMHRLEICNGEGLPYSTVLIDLPDRESCKQWILRNQLGRRNLNDVQRKLLMGRLYKSLKSPRGGDKSHSETLLDAAKKVAEQEHVGRATVFRANDLVDSVDALKVKSPELAKAVETKVIPAKQAAALAATSMSGLRKLEKLNGQELKKAAKATAEKQAAKAGTPKSTQEIKVADRTKAQIKLWYDAVARWLGQSPSIDEYRSLFPGQKGDKVLDAAKELYEAMKAWHGVIK